MSHRASDEVKTVNFGDKRLDKRNFTRATGGQTQ